MYNWLAKSYQPEFFTKPPMITQHIIKKWWPNHKSINIYSYKDYLHIDRHLDNITKNQPKLILCYEEDWLVRCDHRDVRSKMINHDNWQADDLITTESEYDHHLTSMLGLNCIWRPGLPELISYRPYALDAVSVDADKIRYHSSFLYFHGCPVRDKIAAMLQNEHTKLSVLMMPGYNVNNTAYPDMQIKTNNVNEINVPYMDINRDLPWRDQTAFLTVVETMWEGPFAPHLSEKTYKAMHLLRPALIYGGRGTRDYLKRLGFDTWDWFIDWSWDQYADGTERLHHFRQELKRLLDTPISTLIALIDANRSQLINNRNRLLHIVENYQDNPFSS